MAQTTEPLVKEFTLTVEIDKEIINTLVEGIYSLSVELPTSITLQDAKSVPIAITAPTQPSIDIKLNCHPASAVSYQMAATTTPKAATTAPEADKDRHPIGRRTIEPGQTFTFEGGETCSVTKVKGISDTQFGFQNSVKAAPILYRSLNGGEPQPISSIPLWIPGKGVLTPSSDILLWFETTESGGLVSITDESERFRVPFKDEDALTVTYSALGKFGLQEKKA